MSNIRIVKPNAAGPELHISHDAVRAKLEVLLAKNPSAVLIMAEIGDEIETAVVPGSWSLCQGMVRTMYRFFESDGE